jgi:RHS repeat-associated protein
MPAHMRCCSITRNDLASVVLGCLTLSLIAFPAHAIDEWRWAVLGQPGTFSTKAAAVGHMQSLTSIDPRYALLTVERGLSSTNETEDRYRYDAPKIPPNPTPFIYTDSLWGSPNMSSEEDWVAERLARTTQPPGCPPAVLTPNGPWVSTHFGYGNVPIREQRQYRRVIYSAGACLAQTSFPNAIRSRQSLCTSGYIGEFITPGCALPFNATIVGRRQSCESNNDAGVRGNPCNALNGDKSETVVDYSGPYGLRLERYYHSYGSSTFYLMGVGWSHNYQARLAINGGSLAGIIRPNGYRESFTGHTTTGYISTTGTIVKRLNPGAWELHRPDGTVEGYNGSGLLKWIRHPNGGATLTTYTADRPDQLRTITSPFGHQLEFQYDAQDRLWRVVLPDSEVIEYGYTGSNLTSVLYPDGTSVTYHYEDTNFPGHLTGITDESSARFATFGYDSIGRVTLSEHAGGVNQYGIAYNAANSVVTDPLGTQETITFTTDTARARRVTQTSKAGLTRSYTLPSGTTDSQRRLTQDVDPLGLVTKYAYSTAYHLSSKTEAFGTALVRTTTYQYLNNDSDLPTLITEANRTTGFTYDSLGNALTRTITDTTVIPNVARTWTYTYDANGRRLTENGPRTDVSDVTTYAYYTCTTGIQCGQLQTITNALSQTTTFNTYNAHGQPLTITDPNGVVTTLTYDLRQRLTSRGVAGDTTTFEYWPTGLLKKTTLPDGSFALYTYDDAHRLTEIEDAEGNRIEYTLDAMGNRTAEEVYDPSSALVRTRTQVFNSLSQLWKQLGSAGTAAVTTTYAYDNNGNQTSAAAPLSRTTGQLYDELNRLKQITDPGTGETLFGYDANDNLTSVTDPRSNLTSYTYNGLGDLTQQVSPDTGTTVNTYDSGGNLATTTDARSKAGTYSYDALNRVTSVAYPDRTISYGYDSGTNGIGRLTGAADSAHSLAYSYDAHGRVTGKGQTVGAVTKSVGYGYTDGNLTSLVTPSGQTITYGYANGRIDSITLNGSTTVLSDVLYEPFGPVAGWTWGNSSIAARVYDLDGKPTDLDSAGAYSYAYDDAFRITGITDLADSAKTWAYGYDVLDRLNAASRTAETIGYTYDANGNRLSQTGTTAATYTISGSNNRVTSITGTPARTYGYDAAGNVTSYAGLTFTYTDAGRMSTVTSGATTTTYLVNALGQRVKKSNSSTTLLFMYDEAGHVIGEYDAVGALVQETVWMGDVPVAILRPNGSDGVNLFYIHTDHLNTPRRISRPSDNAVLWRWDSDPFGGATANEDPDGDTIAFGYNSRFPGQYFDAESGLSYNYFREYDAATGRYVESDPIGLDGGTNTYAYVAGNPIALTDLEGLDYWVEDADPSESGLGLHQSICVGKYGTGNRFCISFGRKPGQGDCWFDCDGHTYQDRSPPGDIAYPMYRETSRAVDRKIRRYLQEQLGKQRPWDVLGGENCRVFSRATFRQLVERYGGATAAPP